jgi:hypothetical protein
MNTLNMPAFTAETSLYSSARSYVSLFFGTPSAGKDSVTPSLISAISTNVAPLPNPNECLLLCYAKCRFKGGSDELCTYVCCYPEPLPTRVI